MASNYTSQTKKLEARDTEATVGVSVVVLLSSESFEVLDSITVAVMAATKAAAPKREP